MNSPRYSARCGHESYSFPDLATLLAKANEEKSGDQLAGLAACSQRERVAAKIALADVRLSDFIETPVLEPEMDEVSRLLLDTFDREKFRSIASWTVGELRNWLLANAHRPELLKEVGSAIVPEIAAAVAKLMSNKDLVYAVSRIRNITQLRSTMGGNGVLGIRIQPNHPTDDLQGILLSTLEGLSFGCGDAVIGVNPATESVEVVGSILRILNQLIDQLRIPTQACCLAHITTQLQCLRQGIPVDLLFQSIAGTERANASFGVNLSLLQEGRQAVLESHLAGPRNYIGNNVMYFETGQGSALSSESHHNIDQLTLEARAYGVARVFSPFLVNSVVGFIGPEYLFDERQITRAGLEDHFMGKLLGLPMGCDVCYTNHAAADQNSVDNLSLLLSFAGCNFFMGVPGSDDIMLNYQSTSFHDAAVLRRLTERTPTPEFSEWLRHSPLPLAETSESSNSDTGEFCISESRRDLATPNAASLFGNIVQSVIANSSSSLAPTAPCDSMDMMKLTSARLALGCCGKAMLTQAQLQLREDHALAVDAVQNEIRLSTDFSPAWVQSCGIIEVTTKCNSKREYLLRPDLGRSFSDASRREILKNCPPKPDIQFIIGDGLSASAALQQAPELLSLLLNSATEKQWKVGTPLFVRNCRVGILNDIGVLLQPEIAVLLIGERPGLATSESLSVYMAHRPNAHHTDANRNLISNIHSGGIGLTDATRRILRLIEQFIQQESSGVHIKEQLPNQTHSIPHSKVITN